MRLCLLLPVLLLVLAGCGCDRKPPTPTKLYAINCSGCHGPHGEGSSAGKPLVGNPFVRGLSDDQLMQFIKLGRSPNDPLSTSRMQMPPKGGNPNLTDEQIRLIIGHIRTLQQEAAPPGRK